MRYAYLNPRERREALPLDFEYLGVTVSEPEFERFADLAPRYATRLREFDSSAEPLATAPGASGVVVFLLSRAQAK